MDWFELLEFAQDAEETRGAAWMVVAVLKEYDRQKAEDAATTTRPYSDPKTGPGRK